jgi:hypothetical protein
VNRIGERSSCRSAAPEEDPIRRLAPGVFTWQSRFDGGRERIYAGLGVPMSDDNALADVLAFVLSGRPERVNDAVVAQMRPEQRAAVGPVAETIAALGQALPPVEASARLKERVLATIRERRAHEPRRALVVCDMINDHLAPGGPLEIPRARGIVDALAKRIGEARASGVPVVYVVDQHDPEDPELDVWGAHRKSELLADVAGLPVEIIAPDGAVFSSESIEAGEDE